MQNQQTAGLAGLPCASICRIVVQAEREMLKYKA
jgi:hypothetical protein